MGIREYYEMLFGERLDCKIEGGHVKGFLSFTDQHINQFIFTKDIDIFP